MSDERVSDNGVPRGPGWPAHIEAARRLAHYAIGGRPCPRIRYGDEPDDWGADRQACHDCGVHKGQFHVGPACDVERCPG
jgi:hypothetical protein